MPTQQPQQLTIEQALQNLDTVCANTNGNRETHLVLLAGLELIKMRLDQNLGLAEKVAELSVKIVHLEDQLAIRYEDNAEPSQPGNGAGEP